MAVADRILIVEDDNHVATVLAARLQSMGYMVCAMARTGTAAVRNALAQKPDLILMDILLEGDMNGIEAAELITNQMNVPIVFITCLSEEPLLDRAVTANAFGYILKPYDRSELRYTVEIALVKSKAAREHDRLIRRLEKALQEVNRLSGLLPICASCKRIRDEAGKWQDIETYISCHSEADFTHGICPKCATRLYPDFFSNGDM
ncbi:MAG: response regulator [Desulfatitalea sp.]|nr:response regulator [Desulfatitalea sp.]NNK00803.1 response regulator [Desulfatitalea sp.]